MKKQSLPQLLFVNSVSVCLSMSVCDKKICLREIIGGLFSRMKILCIVILLLSTLLWDVVAFPHACIETECLPECSTSELAQSLRNRHKLATMIGIGHAKTGSTHAWELLASHPLVTTGVKRKKKEKTIIELAFFSKLAIQYEKSQNLSFFNCSKALLEYSSFFHPLKNPVLILEKSPMYSRYPEVPYFVHSVLGQQVKFVYTTRPIIEIILSYYRFRNQKKAMSGDRSHFCDYIMRFGKGWSEVEECRVKTLNNFAMRNKMHQRFQATVDMYSGNLTRYQAWSMEVEIFNKCGHHAMERFDIVLSYLRWQFLFGPEKILIAPWIFAQLEQDLFEKTLARFAGLRPDPFLNANSTVLPMPLQYNEAHFHSMSWYDCPAWNEILPELQRRHDYYESIRGRFQDVKVRWDFLVDEMKPTRSAREPELIRFQYRSLVNERTLREMNQVTL